MVSTKSDHSSRSSNPFVAEIAPAVPPEQNRSDRRSCQAVRRVRSANASLGWWRQPHSQSRKRRRSSRYTATTQDTPAWGQNWPSEKWRSEKRSPTRPKRDCMPPQPTRRRTSSAVLAHSLADSMANSLVRERLRTNGATREHIGKTTVDTQHLASGPAVLGEQ